MQADFPREKLLKDKSKAEAEIIITKRNRAAIAGSSKKGSRDPRVIQIDRYLKSLRVRVSVIDAALARKKNAWINRQDGIENFFVKAARRTVGLDKFKEIFELAYKLKDEFQEKEAMRVRESEKTCS